jgi:hypothetical protein
MEDPTQRIKIDGAYADSLAQEEFCASVLNGAVPEPILTTGARSLKSRLVYTAPESLITPPKTLLSACGLINSTLDAALNATHCICKECGARLSKLRSPLELLNAISRRWRARRISIYASSSHTDFIEWAEFQGLALAADEAKTPTVCLGQLLCQEDTITEISALVHSVWRLTNPLFTCKDYSGEKQSYSPSGWCEHCRVSAQVVSRSDLHALLTGKNSTSDTLTYAGLLEHQPFQTVQQLLDLPIGELPLDLASPLYRAKELISTNELGALSFGSKTDLLDASDLTRLSIVCSILASDVPYNQISLDIPRGIFDTTEARLIHKSGSSPAGSAPILSLPGDLSNDGIEKDLLAGDLLQISRALKSRGSGQMRTAGVFKELTKVVSSNLDSTHRSNEFVAIPVFQPVPKTAKVLAGELGLMDPIAQLYSASLDARTSGLTARDFTLFGARSPRYVCEQCRGLGVLLTYHDHLPRPLAQPCQTCAGLRCKAPVSSALFRGVPFSTLFNRPIESSIGTLAALSKAKLALNLTTILELNHLLLGMPIALLSHSEQRRLALVKALLKGRPSKPVIIVIEQPDAGLSDDHRAGLRRVRDDALLERRAVWVEVV